jgi:hypothetical protein
MDKLKNWLSNVMHGLLALVDSRTLLLLVPAMLYLFSVDAPVANTITFSFVVMIAIAALSHFLRKIIFPYIDLKVFIEQAKTNPIASGQVVLSMAMIICTLIFATVMWVRT